MTNLCNPKKNNVLKDIILSPVSDRVGDSLFFGVYKGEKSRRRNPPLQTLEKAECRRKGYVVTAYVMVVDYSGSVGLPPGRSKILFYKESGGTGVPPYKITFLDFALGLLIGS